MSPRNTLPTIRIISDAVRKTPRTSKYEYMVEPLLNGQVIHATNLNGLRHSLTSSLRSAIGSRMPSRTRLRSKPWTENGTPGLAIWLETRS